MCVTVFGLSCHQAYGTANVLLLNSYHPQYAWSDELTRGVQDALEDIVLPENIYIEYMDGRRFVDDPIYSQKLIDLLHYKYQNNKPDIIITSDDAAYYFMLEFGEDFFPQVPIVFCGVNVFDAQLIADRKNITGIAEGMDIYGNLILMKRLQPSLKKIVILGGTMSFGLPMLASAKKIQLDWQEDPETSAIMLEIWDDFSLAELYQRVEGLPQNTAILMLAIHKDNLGQYFSFDEHLPLLTAKSKVPIYGMWGALMIGKGAIGGMMSDAYQHGFNTGEMAVQVLSGISIKDIPLKLSAKYLPKFDYVQLKRFAIDMNLLPENSKIFNQPYSIYQANKVLIDSVAVVFVLLIFLITGLVRNIRQKIVAQQQLKIFNLKLEATVHDRTYELEQRNAQLQMISHSLKKLANTDSLTSLHNRRAASKDIPAYLQRYNISFKPFILAILDIDHFKKINDSFGHHVGDKVLISLAKTLTNSLRPSDRVYRWGGEEFLVALPETTLSEAADVFQRLATNIHRINVEKVRGITVSFGVTEFVHKDSFDVIVQRADEALYKAKNTGRDKMVVG